MVSLQYEKVTQVLNYLLRKSENHTLDKVHLVKLTWAADRFHLRKYGRLITEDIYVAMPQGPVASLALDIINEKTDYNLPAEYLPYTTSYLIRDEHIVGSLKDTDLSQLSESDQEALDFAWNTFGSTENIDELVDFTHQYPEWSKFASLLQTQKTSVPMDYLDFFNDPEPTTIESDPFELDAELKSHNKEQFKNLNSVKTALYI